MSKAGRFWRPAAILLLVIASITGVSAQKKSKKKDKVPDGRPVMWEKVRIDRQDTFYGPGGKAMQPDLSRITFIKKETGGHNKKFRIKDGSGRIWVAKPGREAQPETASVRLMSALGYKTEINYLVPSLTIPGKGTFRNVRLEARPDDVERLGNWHWKRNPFVGTNEFQGLKIMMVLLHNWDIVDVNNTLLGVIGNNGREVYYTVGDLGATFGRLGNNNFPVIYRLGRSVGKPRQYAKSILVREVEKGRVELSYKGKQRYLFDNITVANARWLADLLLQLRDEQIEDAFRAANYSAADIEIYKKAIKAKIYELDQAGSENLALR
ncbi:MAG: hypothetical protein JSS81_08660 [Acidobacteria bacterium]|nr:hypothetical protein [Acidobacteriota bacterium]